MNLKIHIQKDEYKEATGIVVIIDVLRACTTVPILFQQGAKEIIPVKTTQEASNYEEYGHILIGEGEHGSVHDSFHYNNSPSEICNVDFSGKTLVLRSNNATQAILNAEKADEIVLASFVNMDAVAMYILNHNLKDVTLVPLGRLGEKGLEDELCAEAIKCELEGKAYDFDEMRDQIVDCECAVLVRDTLGRPDDVTIALMRNSYPVVAKVHSENNLKVLRPVK